MIQENSTYGNLQSCDIVIVKYTLTSAPYFLNLLKKTITISTVNVRKKNVALKLKRNKFKLLDNVTSCKFLIRLKISMDFIMMHLLFK